MRGLPSPEKARWGKETPLARQPRDRMAAAGRARCDEGSYGHDCEIRGAFPPKNTKSGGRPKADGKTALFFAKRQAVWFETQRVSN